MLISFSVENFFSFKEEAVLSLVAGNGKEMRDSHVFTPELKNEVKTFDLLRSAVIYGPNAGGKSNFFKALAIMAKIVNESNKGFEILPLLPFVLNEKTEKAPSIFEVIMVIGKVRYQYGFSATSERIHAEWLFAFPKGSPQKWFERDYNKKTEQYDYTLGEALKGQKKVWQEITNPKALFLSTAVQLNSTQLKPIYDWFTMNMWFIDANDLAPDLSLEYCKEYGSKKIIAFLKAADFAIEDIKAIKVKPKSEIISKYTAKLSDFPLSIEQGEKKHFQAVTLHKTESGNHVGMNLEMESDGTLRMLALALPFLEVLENGSIMIIDELNQRLHPHLMRYLIDMFNNPKTNPNNAQLIFTTHAVSLLKKDIFRRDQIWFCERGGNQASTLFPLTDFKPRKGHEDFESYYMNGRYGALPIIGEFSDFAPKEVSK